MKTLSGLLTTTGLTAAISSATRNIVAGFGIFVEIGRKDFMDGALMPSSFLLRNITFAYLSLALVIENHKWRDVCFGMLCTFAAAGS